MNIQTSEPVLLNREKITRKIAKFWNKTSEGWLAVWGPHIHHGYYDHMDHDTVTPLAAQERLMQKLAEMLPISPQDNILDAGCGMGGSSLYLAETFGAWVFGITLSQKQLAIARENARAANVNNVKFMIEDALQMQSFSNASIDILWSLESCEQFYDKALFLRQAYRVLKPGGTLMLATWCSDQDEYTGYQAKQYLKLCRAFDLPYMPTMGYYQRLINQTGFQLCSSDEWSFHVRKSWEAGLTRAQNFSLVSRWKLGGIRGMRFLKQAHLMREAFDQSRVLYGVFIARKPL